MPDVPWRSQINGRAFGPFRFPVWISWRVQRLCSFLVKTASCLAIEAVSRIRILQVLPRALLVPFERALLRQRARTLFDAEHYLNVNADVRNANCDPLRHYLLYGWREGRNPNARFDELYYRSEAGLAPTVPVSGLGHFVALGERADLSPCPGVSLSDWFRTHPEIGIARSNTFDDMLTKEAAVLRTVPDIETSRKYLAACRPIRSEREADDVIMPVFRGHAETLNALCHALTAKCQTSWRVVVIDDQIPDLALKSDIRNLARRGLIDLIEQPSNRGFVAAINRGMAQNPDRDVVWLNSDTEVYDGWLDRLRAAAYSAPKVATVTPLSNNATLCSYPRIDTNNAMDLELPWRHVDRIAAKENAGIAVDAPTSVGFATYVRRDAIEDIGALDEASFGRGYGEENDFSQRAIKAGWRNLLAADTLVRHFGGVSFGSEKSARIASALAVLDRKYPCYRADVQRFMSEDPLRAARHSIDFARLMALRRKENVLIVTHTLGGGTKQHVESEISRLSSDGTSVFLLTGSPGRAQKIRLSHPNAGALPSFEGLDLDEDELWKILEALALDHVQIHHLIDFSEDAPSVLRQRLDALRLPWSFTVHDYFSVCPRINMVDLSGMYCGEPDVAGCRRCLLRRGSPKGRPDIASWRSRYHALLSGARRIVVPDRDVADRLRANFPDLGNLSVIPHETCRAVALRVRAPRRGPLRVAVIGAIGPIKGIDVVMATALRAQREADGPQFTVVGYTHNDTAAKACGISVTGSYDNAEVDLLLEKVDPDVIWIPSIWPETYCYTLSIALRSGLPIVGFEIGAVATRLSDAGCGYLVPLTYAKQPDRLIEAFKFAAAPEIAAKAVA
ncbi:MAG: glycosyltransferase [Paracoccaceae bacterium]